MAAVYATANAAGPFNAYYERPATIAMLGEIRGQRVLEIGCGAGPLSEWLVEQGARLTAFDVSPAMVQLAERRLGSRADVFQADLASGLGFAAAESFDVVVASLVMHYLRDWDAAFSEVRRVLAPSGRFLFSTHHPTADARLHSPEDYFAVMEVTEEWGGEEWGGKRFPVSFWRRPLTAMAEAITAAGFVIVRLVEPRPEPELEQIDSSAFHRLRTQPGFLFFELRPRPSSWD